MLKFLVFKCENISKADILIPCAFAVFYYLLSIKPRACLMPLPAAPLSVLLLFLQSRHVIDIPFSSAKPFLILQETKLHALTTTEYPPEK